MTATENKTVAQQIAELTILVDNASTPTVEGRQTVADCCKKLYNAIEEDVFNADKEWMLKGMYADLCSGNFAEPFYCEKKKDAFHTVVAIYNDRVVPYL
jgi:hypothetical protein